MFDILILGKKRGGRLDETRFALSYRIVELERVVFLFVLFFCRSAQHSKQDQIINMVLKCNGEVGVGE